MRGRERTRNLPTITGIIGRGSEILSPGLRGRDANFGGNASRPRRHHDHPLRKIDRLEHRMRDEDDGLAQIAPQRQQIVVQPKAGDFIERGERFIHQQDVRIGDERARQRDPHLHAARQFARVGIGKIGKPHLHQGPVDLGIRFQSRHARQPQRQPDILPHAGPRHQCRFLKYKADRMSPARRDSRPSHANRAGCRLRSDRRSGEAPSTCHSRTAQAARRTRPCARQDPTAPTRPRRCRRPW